MDQPPRHGTPNCYQHEMKSTGSACQECSEANRDYARSWRIRTGHTERIKVPLDLLRSLVASEDANESAEILKESVGQLTGSSILTMTENR